MNDSLVMVCDGYVDFAESWAVPLYQATARRVPVVYLQPDPDHAGFRGWRSLLLSRRPFGARTGRPGLEVVRLPALLPGSRFRVISHLNRWLALRQLLRRLVARGQRPVLMLQRPYLLPSLRGLPAALRVYEVTDDYVASTRTPGRERRVRRAHHRFLRQADLVWASTDNLVEQVRRQRRDAERCTMGVDYVAFSAGTESEVPEPLRRLGRPRVGLVGRLNDRIDWPLVESLCDRHPEWHIVLVGPIYLAGSATRRALEQLEKRKNFHLLPAVPRSEMPAYIAHLDVCLIPYRVYEGTVGINPLKLYEYLATGRPVVSTPLPAVENFADVVTLAGPHAFVDAVNEALESSDDPESAEVRRQRARPLDWQTVADHRLEQLAGRLGGTGGTVG